MGMNICMYMCMCVHGNIYVCVCVCKPFSIKLTEFVQTEYACAISTQIKK